MTTDHINKSLADIVHTLGIKEPINGDPLAALHRKRASVELAKTIANQMGLPIDLRLSSTNDGASFGSKALSPTDASGRGTHGIAAHVVIPTDLPMIGTARMNGFIIQMVLGKEFHAQRAETAVALLAHELSHVLLHSIQHERRESEQFTDLVPLVLGFTDIVQRGRKIVTSEQRGNQIHTVTTTLGYLSDGEFQHAVRQVENMLAPHRAARSRLADAAFALGGDVEKAVEQHSRFVELLNDLGSKRRNVRASDAQRIVALHQPDHLGGFETSVRRAALTASEVEEYARSLCHYTAQSARIIDDAYRRCSEESSRLRPLLKQVEADVRLLSRNRPIVVRIIERLASIFPRRRFQERPAPKR